MAGNMEEVGYQSGRTRRAKYHAGTPEDEVKYAIGYAKGVKEWVKENSTKIYPQGYKPTVIADSYKEIGDKLIEAAKTITERKLEGYNLEKILKEAAEAYKKAGSFGKYITIHDAKLGRRRDRGVMEMMYKQSAAVLHTLKAIGKDKKQYDGDIKKINAEYKNKMRESYREVKEKPEKIANLKSRGGLFKKDTSNSVIRTCMGITEMRKGFEEEFGPKGNAEVEETYKPKKRRIFRGKKK